ncbi:MAG: HD domain-containing protein [Pirellulales bacterium]
MSRRFVRELGDQENVDQVFLASDKQVRSNRQGNPFLTVRLTDKTGTVNALQWNATDSVARLFDSGDYVRVEGKTHIHQGELQIIVKKISRADAAEIVEEHFRLLTPKSIGLMEDRMRELLGTMTNPHLARLAEAYLVDDEFMKKFRLAPAGVKNHHAYKGGLLEHVVQLMEVVSRIADLYPQVDRDLLLMGAVLHDSGKVDELAYSRDFAYTDEGQLLGHIVLAVEMLDKKLNTVGEASEAIPADLALHLKHMIVSHHGSRDFGSPTLPMTIEAMVLHFLDNLDAKVHFFEAAVRDDANLDSPWTQFHPSIGRKLYKPRPGGDTG